jgi:hypothetical protein
MLKEVDKLQDNALQVSWTVPAIAKKKKEACVSVCGGASHLLSYLIPSTMETQDGPYNSSCGPA